MHRIQKVAIETIRDCNGKCRICNYRNKRTVFTPSMKIEVFRGTIAQLKGLPNLKTVCPYNHNEPLLDLDLFSKIRYIKAHLPNVKIEVSTNGLLLTEKNIDLYCAVVDDRWISFHGVNKATYEHIMGIPWANALKLREMIWQRPHLKFDISVGLTSKYTEEDVRDFWSDYKNVKLMIFEPRSRCGSIESDEVKNFHNPPTPDFDCWRFNKFLVYNTRGFLIPCSNDLGGVHRYADYTMSLDEIMTRREYFRRINREGKRTICWRCQDSLDKLV